MHDSPPFGGTGTETRPGGATLVDTDTRAPWRTVVWNDPVNLMSYVAFVFRRHFGYSRLVAEQLMLQVHEEGRAIVSRGSREQMENDVTAMHSYGLHATIERAGEED
ncbi:ATP-dependent Clp protease adapter ClpS [Brachybacterium sp. Marseille-Q7125]|uniref:ATP-dependent Clp protease adapter ClpS n=1 Tax=Brachybacterium sp. Marseille-Q7125 TaxID=2932815 RepID=UPI001FF25EB5|nr:ATP-dependent Clp protease adapter ClpS [Brachybacterium sp. Marseille-Q7125]